MASSIQDICVAFLEFVKEDLSPRTNKPISPSTMSSFRRAMEGFAYAVDQVKQPLASLPDDFLETTWMATQESVHSKPIHLRIRVGAIIRFLAWLRQNRIPFPETMRIPNITTPARRTEGSPPFTSSTPFTPTVVRSPVTPAPEEPEMNDLPLNDPMNDEVNNPPQTQSLPPQQTATQAAPRLPKQQAPAKQPELLNARKDMVRVRRERPGDDPIFISDHEYAKVAAFGALDPFLKQVVGPGLNIVGDVTFLVARVVDGREGPATRCSVTLQSSNATQQPPAVKEQVMTQTPNNTDVLGAFEQQRRVLEEQEARMLKRIEEMQRGTPQGNSEMDSIKSMLGSLASSVQALAQRVEAREMEQQAPPPPPVAAGTNSNDILAMVLKQFMEQKVAPPPVAEKSQSLFDDLSKLTQLQTLFAQKNVQIDTSPLEEQLADLRKQLAETTKKDELSDVMVKVKAMMDFTKLLNGDKPVREGAMGFFGGLLEKVINDPSPLAEAAERILTAARSGAPMPPGAAKPNQQQGLPPAVKAATEQVLTAAKQKNEEAIVVAMHNWMSTMVSAGEPFSKITKKLSDLFADGENKRRELGLLLKHIFTQFGYGQHADPVTVTWMVTAVVETVAEVNAGNQEEIEEEEEVEVEETPAEPDLVIRVGGAAPAEAEVEEPEEEEGGEEEEPEEEGEEPEEAQAANESPEAEEPEEEVAPAPEPAAEPEATPSKPRRGKKNAEPEVKA